MKIKQLQITIITFLISFLGYAGTSPPTPQATDGGAEPPPPLPIDNYIWHLFALAILLGTYQLIIYTRNKKTQSKI